jgi:hypothetical protein
VKHRLLLLFIVVLSLAVVSPARAADYTIKEVRFEAADTAERTETVHIVLNALLYPTIFALVENTPRVVCDFINAEPAKDINRTIEANGRYIQRIRIGVHADPKTKTRIVLDLVPDRDYTIQQIPSPKNNSFNVVVRVAGEENAPAADEQIQEK